MSKTMTVLTFILTYNPVTLSVKVTLIHCFSTNSAEGCVSVLGSYLA